MTAGAYGATCCTGFKSAKSPDCGCRDCADYKLCKDVFTSLVLLAAPSLTKRLFSINLRKGSLAQSEHRCS